MALVTAGLVTTVLMVVTLAGGGFTTSLPIVRPDGALGLGYGATQNLTLVAAFARARQRETATVSSVWNVGFDTGTAVGAGLVGAMTVVLEVPGGLAVTALLVARACR